MLQQTRASECHCCLMVKYLSQLHEQFISPVPLVQFNWYCERRGDNDEVLTLGRDLIDLLFPNDVYRRSLLFFLARSLRSLMFSKRTKRKIKQRLCTGYRFYVIQDLTDICSNVEHFHPRGHVQVCCRNLSVLFAL